MNTVRLILGDSLVKLKDLESGSIDAVVSDPPYELTANKKGGSGLASVNLESPYGRSRIGTGNGGGFMGMKWDSSGIAFDPELWGECFRILKPNGIIKAFSGTRTYHRMAQAMRRVGFVDFEVHAWTYGSGFPKSMNVGKAVDALLLTGGSDSRRIKQANALRPGEAREATFLPINGIKSTTRSSSNLVNDNPATDAANQWSGYGTALKPAWEPIIVARKPYP
jgi:hypothetical protein